MRWAAAISLALVSLVAVAAVAEAGPLRETVLAVTAPGSSKGGVAPGPLGTWRQDMATVSGVAVAVAAVVAALWGVGRLVVKALRR